jgi:hypothetical protein
MAQLAGGLGARHVEFRIMTIRGQFRLALCAWLSLCAARAGGKHLSNDALLAFINLARALSEDIAD